ncbi:MFS transporter [Planctomycetota bacterium]
MTSSTDLPRDAYSKAKITNIISGSTGPIAFSLLAGIILTKYVLDLGVEPAKLGIIHIATTVSVVLQFFGAFIVEKTGKKRNTFILFGILRWVPIILMFFIPFIPKDFRLLVLSLIYLTRGFMAHMCSAAWNNMMNDIVPGNRRGRFWATRNILANISSAGGVLVFSRIIDFYKSEGSTFTGYFITFGVAFAFGLIDNLIHIILPEKEIPEEERESIRFLGEIKETCISVFADKGMRAFLFYFCALTFQANILMLTSRVYTLDKNFLNIPLSTMGTYTSIILMLSVAGYFIWGRIGDQFGYKIPIIFNLFMRFGMIVPWIFMTPDNFKYLIWIWIPLAGLFNVGLFLNTTSTMHAVVPERRRAHHMAFLTVFPILCGTVSGAFFYGAVRFLKGMKIHILGIDFSDIRFLFLVVICLNAIIIILSTQLKAPKGRPASRIFHGFFRQPGGFRTFWNVLATGFNIGEDQMIEHTKKMGAMENPIAVNQLIQGLQDPSFRVRQESAWALGRISHNAGRLALENILENPSSMIHDEAVWSLGKIGNEESVDILLTFLTTDDAGFRARVALALGEIRSPKAIGPLVELLENEDNQFVQECIFDSLAILEDTSVLPQLIRSFAKETSALSRRHMAMSAGVYIDGKKDEFYKLLEGEIEVKGTVGNTVSAKIRSGLKKLSLEEYQDEADKLGDLFWDEEYGDVIDFVLRFYSSISDKNDKDDIPSIVLRTMQKLDRNQLEPGMEIAAIAMYSLMHFIQDQE